MAIEKYISTSFHIERSYDCETKVASVQFPTFIPPEIQGYVEKLLAKGPDPRFSYIHMVAMTDGDRYGSNLNGDTFSWEELTGIQSPEEAAKNTGPYTGICLPRYKTFEQASFFKHHDNNEFSPRFGDIPCAAVNEPLRRIELIVRVARQAIRELNMQSGAATLHNFDQKGFFCGSMGTRIDHEKCSICGNKNQFIHQRCHHLKNMMNQILPDGRQVTASNHGVRFFDFSDVEYNPADDNAIALAKVASASPHSALNQARDVGDMNQWWAKQSEIEKHIPVDAASIMAPRTAPAGTVAAVPPIPEEVLKVAGVAGLSAFVSTAAAMGIVLSPDELLGATAAAEPTKSASFDGDFEGFTLRLDNIDMGVYDALLSSVPSRSGFVAPCAAAGWEPSKIADAGYPGLADYYAFYRASLGAISKSQFEKTAYQRLLIRDLIDTHGANIPNAIHHLAYAGYDLQNPGRIQP